MIVNIDNVYVASVDDITEDVIHDLELDYIIIVGKGLYPYYKEFKQISYNEVLYFPLEDYNNEENRIFAENILKSVYAFIQDDYPNINRLPKIMFCCGAGMSRSPFLASKFLERDHFENDYKYYYYKFKEQNKSIKSMFVE